MGLDESIQKLNYKYQFIKNNKFWDYNQDYVISLNGMDYQVKENDILLNIAQNVSSRANSNFVKRNNMSDYEIANIDVEQMKNIVISFYMNIDPNLKDKLATIFSKIDFIKYDENIPDNKQRSFANENGIRLYYKEDLQSLVTLAHEVSHGISNLDDNCILNDKNKVKAFSEIESELTEKLFLDYLKNNGLQVRDKKTNEIRQLNDKDIDNINYNKYSSVLFHSYRAIEELKFKRFMKENKISDIDMKIIEKLSKSTGIDEKDLVTKIETFINEYYPSDNTVHNYVGIQGYDLKDGKHLSNESRFIYAYCFVAKFNAMNLEYKEKIEFYKNYLKNAKTMSFQEVLNLFDVDLSDSYKFSEEFINEYNYLANNENSIYKSM